MGIHSVHYFFCGSASGGPLEIASFPKDFLESMFNRLDKEENCSNIFVPICPFENHHI